LHLRGETHSVRAGCRALTFSGLMRGYTCRLWSVEPALDSLQLVCLLPRSKYETDAVYEASDMPSWGLGVILIGMHQL